jgi:DNA polymerase III subunit gamma/tau
MSYQVFARKYRPKTFADVLGQDHVVRTLRNAIEKNRLAQAYLFVGPRGTGKTSTARILAKALNCTGGPKADFDPHEDACVEIAEGRSLDVLEIDGASNNSVDQVRDLREQIYFQPSRGQFRIFYIDEVHMLTTAAFNALLKTLEEPPAHVKFIFATTDVQKVLPTIISRCQRFDLRRIPDHLIAEHLLHIAQLENIQLDPLAAHGIARGADGGMRDAQSMLDQLVSFCGEKINEEDVHHIFGFTAHQTISGLADAILEKNTALALDRLHTQNERGRDLTKLLADLIAHFRNILIHKVDPQTTRHATSTITDALSAQSALITTERLLTLIDQFAEVDSRMKWAPNKLLYLEIGFIKAIRSIEEVSLSDVIQVLRSGGEHLATLPPTENITPTEKKTPSPARVEPAAVSSPAAEPVTELAAAPAPAFTDTFLSDDESATEHLQGEDLWRATLADMELTKPMQAGYAAAAVFLHHEGDRVTIGFSPQSKTSHEAMTRPQAKSGLESTLSRLAGRPIHLSIEVRDDITPPAPPAPPPPPEPKAKEPTPAKPDPKSTDKKSASAENATPAFDPTPTISEEEFYSDPQIEQALKIFQAKITTITKVPTKNSL